jgi:hypothetical protein
MEHEQAVARILFGMCESFESVDYASTSREEGEASFTRSADDIVKSGRVVGSVEAAVLFRTIMIAREVPTSFVLAYRDGLDFARPEPLTLGDIYCFNRVLTRGNADYVPFIVDPFATMVYGFVAPDYCIDMGQTLRYAHPLDSSRSRYFLREFHNHHGSFQRYLEDLDAGAMGISDLRTAALRAQEVFS